MGYPFNFLETLSDLWQSLGNLGCFSLSQMFWLEILETANALIIGVELSPCFWLQQLVFFLLINVKKVWQQIFQCRRKNCRVPAHFDRAT